MKIFKTIFSKRVSRIWFIVSASVIVFLLIASILVTTVFGTVFISLLGNRRAVFAQGSEPVYESDYDSKAKTLAAANAFNEKICEEGFVLLKNKDNALPIYTPRTEGEFATLEQPKVSVFGKNSVNIAYGGAGSGEGGGGEDAISLYDSLHNAGYLTNPQLENFYNSSASGAVRPIRPEGSNMNDGKTVGIPTYETPLTSYPAGIDESYSEYNDAAIIVISRMGGEGFDLPRTMEGIDSARRADDHYLQIDKNETDLLNMVCNAGFDKVILVLNVGTSFELGFLFEDSSAVYNQLKGYDIDASKIDAAIWTGFPGNTGMAALGRIMNGNVNPSGRTVDTYAMDFKADPTWNNIGDNRMSDGDRYFLNGNAQDYYFVDYDEDIYVGYRYYETRAYDEVNSQDGDADWYKKNVVLPFGYGLSYTTFEWEIVDDSSIRNVAVKEGETYTISVRVTNKGDVAGKDVVQLYGHAPYDQATFGIQKAHKVLLDFAKTDLIPAGESDVVELEVNPYYRASYDYSDANGNNFYGYELEPGDYSLYVATNAHYETLAPIPFTVQSSGNGMGIAYDTDPVTDNPVVNRYTDLENGYFNSDFHLDMTLNRDAWDEWTTSPVNEAEGIDTRELGSNDALLSILMSTDVENMPGMPDYSEEPIAPFGKPVSMRLRDIMTNAEGVYGFAEGTEDTSVPFVDYDDIRWETLIEQCTVEELMAMRDTAAFNSGAIESIGKPLTNDTDGPAGFVNFMVQDGTYYDTCYYASQMTVASTWSKEIAEGFGEMVGNEGIWGADGRGNGMPYSGWYAPGANLHRSPFGGRNFEYMSEDSVFTGKMAAAQIKGAQSKGVYCFIKHFAVNDQETHRSSNGICVWLTEQALREIYLRPFEIAVKEGGSRAVMSSFNRIGSIWTGGDYRLLTQILREEWGFRGSVISDFTSGSYMDSKQMAYAGGDLNLNNQTTQYLWTGFDANNPADVNVLRQTAKNIMYTVVNSNAMNNDIIGYRLPLWQVLLIVGDCVVVAGLAVWGFFAIRSAMKQNKKNSAEDK